MLSQLRSFCRPFALAYYTWRWWSTRGFVDDTESLFTSFSPISAFQPKTWGGLKYFGGEMNMQHTKGKEDQDLKEFFRVLGLTATIEILKSIQKGKNQYVDFFTAASVSTINERIKQLITLGIIEHHLGREPKRKEWYTLTKRGERVLKAIVRLEKAFQGK